MITQIQTERQFTVIVCRKGEGSFSPNPARASVLQMFVTRTFPSGVSLIEVIFAIGVILIGLLGLMSVLPLAGNRAQSAVGLNTASAVADSAYGKLLSGNYLNAAHLLIAKPDPLETLPAPPTLTGAFPSAGPFPANLMTQPLCIDPLHVVPNPAYPTPDPFPAVTSESPLVAPGNGYTPVLFPYYFANHNPLLDPSVPADAPNTSRNLLQGLPRMRRVGLRHTDSGRVYNLEESLRFVENQDDIPSNRPKNPTLDVTVPGLPATAGGLPYGKRLATGEYSWFATFVPSSSRVSERFAILSIVVVRNRNRSYSFPVLPVATAEGNANAERVALVTAARGFHGGAGGVVELVSSSSLRSSIPSGSWLMLSSGNRHRWYRVAGTDGDAEFGTATTFGIGSVPPNQTLWRRRVQLDGSDWQFNFLSPINVSNQASFTHATLVDGVVSVTERIVRTR
jgi:hypothetical protein